jgi:hypothetical protein
MRERRRGLERGVWGADDPQRGAVRTPRLARDGGRLDGMKKPPRAALGVAGLIGLLVAVVAARTLQTAEVVAKGKLVPSGGEGVRRVRVWDALEFYISSETARPDSDLLTIVALAMAAAVLGFSALLLIRAGRRDRTTVCFILAALGASWLAFDEMLAIHESVGHNLQFLRGLTGVERPDDLVFAAYLLPAAAFFWIFRSVLLSVPVARALFVAGGSCVVLASLSDLSGFRGEEAFEFLGAASLGCGFVWLAAVTVGSAVRTASADHAEGARPAEV